MNEALPTALVLLMGLGLAIAGFAGLSIRRGLRSRLRSMPRTLAREARAGSTVKLVGQLVARAPVHAPLANVACAYFQMTVKEVLNKRDDESSLETMFSEREFAEGWELEDESGRIAVQPEGAEIQYIRLRSFTPGGAAWDPALRYDLLSRYFNTSRDGSTENRMVLEEERLDLGVPVVMVGRVEEGAGSGGPVLTGGPDLQVFGETEKELGGFKFADLMSWAMLATGLLLCATWASQLLDARAPEPLPNTDPIPIQRPGKPAPTKPREE